MALDSVRALKFESPSTGGTQTDSGPTECNPLEDALTAAGLFINGPTVTSADKACLVDRADGNLRLTDSFTSHVLAELVSTSTGQLGSHNALLDPIHFLSDGPGDGWASGAVSQDGYVGPLLVSTTWYTDATLTKKIVGKQWAYSGPLVATEKLLVYASDGTSIVRTITDTFNYNGPLRTTRTRAWT